MDLRTPTFGKIGFAVLFVFVIPTALAWWT
jgi:hypothetical protein